MFIDISNVPEEKITEINKRITKVLANEGFAAEIEPIYDNYKTLNGFKIEVFSEK